MTAPDTAADDVAEITSTDDLSGRGLGGDAEVVEAAIEHEDVDVTYDSESGEYVTTRVDTGEETGRYTGDAPDSGEDSEDAGDTEVTSSGGSGEPDSADSEPVAVDSGSDLSNLPDDDRERIEEALKNSDSSTGVTYNPGSGEYELTTRKDSDPRQTETSTISGPAPVTGDAGDSKAGADGAGGGAPETTRSASIGEDTDGDGLVDGKEPLEKGSLDMPHLVSGRDMDEVLGNFSPQNPGTGLTAAGDGKFLPTTGDAEADQQITDYESTYLSDANSNLDADPASFVSGAVLHNLSGSTGARDQYVEDTSEMVKGIQGIYGHTGDPQLDEAAAKRSLEFNDITEMSTALGMIVDGVARAGDGRNSIAQSVSQAARDAYSQIYDFAEAHDQWQGTAGAEPRANFNFITDDLNAAVHDVTAAIDEHVAPHISHTDQKLGTLTDLGGDLGELDASTGPQDGGTTPSPAGGGVVGGGASGVSGGGQTITRNQTDTSPGGGSGGGGANREAAEKLADMIIGNRGSAQPGGSVPQPSVPQMDMPEMPEMPQMEVPQQQQQTQVPQMDPGMGSPDPVTAPSASGMTMTDDPYESLLNPATHLTRDFSTGDMNQIREGSVSGRDAAAIRPYTVEARSADGMLTSPPASGPGSNNPRFGALGADMRPLDKDGDGKVDDDAVAATAENMTDEDGNPKQVDTAVVIGDDMHPVTMDDPRLLEMMNAVGMSDDPPVTILEAAETAGVPLESYGEMLDPPTDAKPGDVVISSKGNGFYLGEGEVLMEDGEVKDLGEVLELRPPQSGIFRLELPDLPDEVEGEELGDSGEDDPEDEGDAPAGDGEDEDSPAAPSEGGTPPPDAPDPEPAPEPEPEPEPETEPAEPAEEPAPPADEPAEGGSVPKQGPGYDPNAGTMPTPSIIEDDPAEESPAPAPEPDPEPEPSFEGSAEFSASVDDEGVHSSGSAEAKIRDVPFEGEAFGEE